MPGPHYTVHLSILLHIYILFFHETTLFLKLAINLFGIMFLKVNGAFLIIIKLEFKKRESVFIPLFIFDISLELL